MRSPVIYGASSSLRHRLGDQHDLPHRPAGPLLRRHCRQGRRVHQDRGHRAEAAARVGHPQLGARCAEIWRDGRFVLEQETNAYAVLSDLREYSARLCRSSTSECL